MSRKWGTGGDRNRVNLYVGRATAEEIDGEAARLERSRAWVMRLAWQIYRDKTRVTESP